VALTAPPIAVVIAARNEAARLPLLLADLAAAPELVGEVLVVDGASVDGTAG
jgi:glycosyltransferase involved in cell wall biosynthesis